MTSPGSQQSPFGGNQDPLLISPHNQKMSPNSQMAPPQTPPTPQNPQGFPGTAGQMAMNSPGGSRASGPNFPMTSMAAATMQQQQPGFNQDQLFQGMPQDRYSKYCLSLKYKGTQNTV